MLWNPDHNYYNIFQLFLIKFSFISTSAFVNKILGTIEFPSGVSGMANFVDPCEEDEDEVQEYAIELEDEEDNRGRLVMQPGKTTWNANVGFC